MIVHETGMAPLEKPFVLLGNHFAIGSALITSPDTAAGYDPSSIATENTYQAWKGSAPGGFITVDFGRLVNFNTFCLAAHNLGTVAGRVRLAYQASAEDPWTVVATSETATDDEAIAILSEGLINAKAVRISFEVPPLPTKPVVVGVAAIGQRLELPTWQGPDFVRPGDCKAIDGDASLSIEGQYLGATIRRKAGRLKTSLAPVSRTWADAKLAILRKQYDERRPFFYAPGPAGFPDDLVYGWRGDGASELRPAVMTGGALVSFNMELDFYAA